MPFQFNTSLMSLGKETEVSLQVGTKKSGAWDVSETYVLHVNFIRGLDTLSVSADGKGVSLTPAYPGGIYTTTNIFEGEVSKDLDKIELEIEPSRTVATAYVGEETFSSEGETTKEISLEPYKNEDATAAIIPIRLVWPGSDDLGEQHRDYEVKLNLVDYAPSITEQPKDVECEQDATAVLSVDASVEKGALSYQWYEVDGETKTAIDGETSEVFTPDTAEIGEKSYCCDVTNTVNGKTHTTTSNVAKVKVIGKNLEDYTPTITAQPQSIAAERNYLEKETLKVEATTTKGELSYQWYKVGETEDEKLSDEQATTNTYEASLETLGSSSYYCIVTNTVDGQTYTCKSEIATVTTYENYLWCVTICANDNIVTSKADAKWPGETYDIAISDRDDYDIRPLSASWGSTNGCTTTITYNEEAGVREEFKSPTTFDASKFPYGRWWTVPD